MVINDEMMTEDSGPSQPQDGMDSAKNSDACGDSLSSQRVFKKSSPNAKLTLYLSSRDLVVSAGKIDRLQGVLLVDPEFVEDRKVYGQVTLTFRYGREDEEVMGLKFCNEAIMCLAQLYPPHPNAQSDKGNTPLQEALLKRLGPNAYPFSMEITPLAPPSVQLVPAKEYNGAPIGTSYDVRAYVGEYPDVPFVTADKGEEKLQKRSTVRMGIRVVQRAFAPPSPQHYVPGGTAKTNKGRAKEHRRTLLGAGSGLDVAFTPRESPKKMRSDDVVGDDTNNDRLKSDSAENHPKNERSPGHQRLNVTFERPTHVSPEDPSEKTGKPPDDREDDATELEPSSAQDEHENAHLHYRSLCGGKRPSLAAYLAGVPPPRAAVEKPFLLSDGRVQLTASLDKAIYSHGEEIVVNVHVRNGSNKTVRRLKVFIVQHVDVCMFSNGKFKNVVAMLNDKDDCPIQPGGLLDKSFTLIPVKSATKNWIALEDSYTKSGTSLSSTVTSYGDNPDERNVFAIYVSYYVKVKLMVSAMGGQVSLKLPFTLMHTCSDLDQTSESLVRLCSDKQPAPDADVDPDAILPAPPSAVDREKGEKRGT